MCNVESWKITVPPIKVGTVKLNHAVTLEPMEENIVWGKLISDKSLSTGNTVVMEHSLACTAPRNVLVGRTVVSLLEDGCIPVKGINPSNKLKCNCKVADMYICIALEDFDVDCLYMPFQQKAALQCNVVKTDNLTECSNQQNMTVTPESMSHGLTILALNLGLQDIDIS